MKFISYNVGCKVNAYETRAVSSLLINKGYQLGTIKDFDVAIINTCTVTQMASKKSRQIIRRFKSINKKAIVIAMGCYANNNKEEIINECNADIVIGVDHRHKIADYISEFKNTHKKIIKVSDVSYLRNKVKYEELGIARFNENTRAYLKIEDGCDNFCSYCILPITRGRVRSRDKDAIFCEINALLKLGYKEIVLTGIDTSSYGKDFKNYSFSNLLEDILIKFPNLYRLRISSIEISNIDNKFLNLLKRYKNIANHLHIPLQSGCDLTLKRMNRKYTTKEYLEKIKAIRKVRKDIAITTDVIAGFIKESDQEFNQTYNFIKKVGFKQIHAFPFSKRKGTAAFLLEDLPSNIKTTRVNKLLNLSKQLQKKYESKFINKKLEVLFETNGVGLTSNYIRVTGKYKPNEIKLIKLSKSNMKSIDNIED